MPGNVEVEKRNEAGPSWVAQRGLSGESRVIDVCKKEVEAVLRLPVVSGLQPDVFGLV